ncbi:MAG TPA: CPBP family intramembrane glutamic endopeptidase [Chitinophagaceae bacterium]|nr:CPBP family intramembrane glutamic endopeptidase [Chitinophagaceae bacterium]
MRTIIGYVISFFKAIDKRILFLSILFTSCLIFINYYFKLNDQINAYGEILQYASWYVIFLIAFSFAYILLAYFKKSSIFKNRAFLLLLFIAPLLFAWKMGASIDLIQTGNALYDSYWNKVIYWPFKLIIMLAALFIVWRVFDTQQKFYGLTLQKFVARPYFIMLLIMIPLIAAASTQPDFLAMYPKLKTVQFLAGEQNNRWYKLLYELSYGLDFFTIELFFRGFVVLAFSKWVGKDAILPMAIFYCTIHFGKPLGECISSFFGGIILGVVILHTRTIFGGLMVHLGIAWLMELGGYLGNLI